MTASDIAPESARTRRLIAFDTQSDTELPLAAALEKILEGAHPPSRYVLRTVPGSDTPKTGTDLGLPLVHNGTASPTGA